MVGFILWLILLVLAWPLALLALLLYPLVWLLALPFRLIGVSVKGVLDLIGAIIRLPARVLRGPKGLRKLLRFAPPCPETSGSGLQGSTAEDHPVEECPAGAERRGGRGKGRPHHSTLWPPARLPSWPWICPSYGSISK